MSSLPSSSSCYQVVKSSSSTTTTSSSSIKSQYQQQQQQVYNNNNNNNNNNNDDKAKLLLEGDKDGGIIVDRFEKAVNHIKKEKSLDVSNEKKLKLYSYFKQGTVGDCNSSEPSRFSVVAHAKWKAWKELAGKSKVDSMKCYIEVVEDIDPRFKETQIIKEEKPAATPTIKKLNNNNENNNNNNCCSSSKASSSEFIVLFSLCGCSVGVGFCGFLISVLDQQALFFVGLIFIGIIGFVKCVIDLFNRYGLIALYSPMLKTILLDRTLVELILDGRIVKDLKIFLTEISPIFYCKTEQDRLEALSNMSEKTRRIMTTKGIINIMPKWQQRITLSKAEYQRQQAKLQIENQGYRPPLRQVPKGKAKRNDLTTPQLEEQVKLTSKLFRKRVFETMTNQILKYVNPKACRNVSIALSVFFLAQMKISVSARRNFHRFVQSIMLRGSSIGAIVSTILYVLYRMAKKYQKKMK